MISRYPLVIRFSLPVRWRKVYLGSLRKVIWENPIHQSFFEKAKNLFR